MPTKIRIEHKTAKASAKLQGYNQSRKFNHFTSLLKLQGNNCVRQASHSTETSNIIEETGDTFKYKKLKKKRDWEEERSAERWI